MHISRRDFLKGAATGAVGLASMGILGACKDNPSSIATTSAAGGSVSDIAVTSAAGSLDSGTTTTSATINGFGGDVTVTLTVQNGDIVDCEIVGDDETPNIGGRAITEMPDKIIEAGNLLVDGISGATITSNAILNAGQMAYNEAMGIPTGDVLMKPGQYTSGAIGYWSIWELPVTITVDEHSLLKIEVPENRFDHGETEVILESVKDKLFPRMIEHQSVAVDGIAGATVSSNAVKISVENALKEALRAGGTDESMIEHFYHKPEMEYNTVTEEKEVDILVVGLGTGGIVTMKRAIERIQEINKDERVSVLGIDKAGKYGGKSALTHEFNAVNPPKYKALKNEGNDYVDYDGYLDAWLTFTMAPDGTQSAKEDLVRLYFDESGNAIDWLYFEQDWRFGTMSKSDVYDGYVKFNSVLCSNVDPGTYEDRRGIVDTFYKSILAGIIAQGGEYWLETEGYELIIEDGTCKGVKARNNVTGKEYIIHAKAVIMNTGGFGSNEEMLTNLVDPRWAGPRQILGTGMDDGKLIQSALDNGAGTWNIEMSPMVMHLGLPHYLTHYPINFKEDNLNGRTGRQGTWTLNDIPLGMGISADILDVDKNGRRFDDESIVLRFATNIDMESWCAYKAGLYYYAIYSQEQVDALAENGFTCIPRWEGYCAQGGVPDELPLPEIYECLDIAREEGIVWKADSIEDLADQLEIDKGVLAETIDTYNTYAEKGEDEEFGKDPQYLKRIGDGPYYAIKIMNVIFATAGGLDVDTQIRVLQQDHETPINGLYATGNDSLGVLLNKERNYSGFGGVAQGWLLTSGYLAGVNAVNYVQETYGLAEVSPALIQTNASSS